MSLYIYIGARSSTIILFPMFHSVLPCEDAVLENSLLSTPRLESVRSGGGGGGGGLDGGEEGERDVLVAIASGLGLDEEEEEAILLLKGYIYIYIYILYVISYAFC